MTKRDETGRFTTDRALAPERVDPAATTSGAGRGGRLTTDTSDQFGLGFAAPWVLVPPPNAQGMWDIAKIDDLAFGRYRPEQIISLMIDLSPDTSRGLWDYLRFMNPGSDLLAVQLGTDKPHPVAQKAVDDFLQRLADLYGSPDLVWNRQAAGMFLRGAIFTELVLDEDGRIPVDFGTPDPMTARFYRVPDPVRGNVWQLAQMQAGKIQLIDRPTVRYVPIDPVPGSPYGRSIVAPALFSSVFLLLILHDLRRVVAQQGWPRLDITVDVQKVKEQMPQDKRNDPKALKQWVADTIAEATKAFNALEPDDTFVHSEAVVVNRPVGTVDSSSLGAIDPMMRSLERMATRGLKSMPFLMGLSESTTETQAIRQAESYYEGIGNQQRLLASTDSRLIQMGMLSQGIQCDIKFDFKQNRASEEQRDEQVFMLRLANSQKAWEMGLWSQEQASLHAVGGAPDQEEPRLISTTEQPDPLGAALVQAIDAGAAENPEPSTTKGTKTTRTPKLRVRANDSGKLSDKEKEATVSAWDELFPDFKGLLEAEVVG